MDEYPKGEFCEQMGCWNVQALREGIDVMCRNSCCFSAYAFHNWLKERGYKIMQATREAPGCETDICVYHDKSYDGACAIGISDCGAVK